MALPAAHSCHADIRQELGAMKRRREEVEGEEEGVGGRAERGRARGWGVEEWKIQAGVATL